MYSVDVLLLNIRHVDEKHFEATVFFIFIYYEHKTLVKTTLASFKAHHSRFVGICILKNLLVKVPTMSRDQITPATKQTEFY